VKEIFEKIEAGYANKRRGLPYTRFISLQLGKPFAALFYTLNITPNWITLFSALTALGAVIIINTVDGWWGGLAMLVMLQLSYALDCTDGQVARLQGTSSPQGAWFDLLMDRITGFALITGILFWFGQQELLTQEQFFPVFVLCLFANTFFSYAANLKGLIFPPSGDGNAGRSNWLKELVFSPSDTGFYYLFLALCVLLPCWHLLICYSCYKLTLLILTVISTLKNTRYMVREKTEESNYTA